MQQYIDHPPHNPGAPQVMLAPGLKRLRPDARVDKAQDARAAVYWMFFDSAPFL